MNAHWFKKFHGGNKRLKDKEGNGWDFAIKMRNWKH